MYVLILKVDGISFAHFLTLAADAFIEVKAMITVYCSSIRHRLGKEGINCSSLGESLIENIKNSGRALFLAVATARTFIGIYISGLLFNGDSEVSFLTGNFPHPRQSVHSDVWVPTALNHAG